MLLRARDLSHSDTLALTQEFLAQMLGVQRTAVSVVANTLPRAGMIRYRRGRIDIVNLTRCRKALASATKQSKRITTGW